MMAGTGKRLASIQSKIQTIQERLEAGKVGYSAASSCSDLSEFRPQRRRSFFVSTMEKQVGLGCGLEARPLRSP